MKDLCDALTGNFTMANLGCIGDSDYQIPKWVAKALTVVEIDAEGTAATSQCYHRKISLLEPISGYVGKRRFRRNTFAGTCSLLNPRDGIVAAYGMEQYCQPIETVELQCETLPNLLQ